MMIIEQHVRHGAALPQHRESRRNIPERNDGSTDGHVIGRRRIIINTLLLSLAIDDGNTARVLLSGELRPLFETTGKKQIVRVGRHELVSRRQYAEAEEHERAHDVGAIGAIFGERQDHVAAVQLLLGELEQRHEALLRARLHETRRYLEVEPAAPQDALPAPVPRRSQRENERQADWLLARGLDQLGCWCLFLLLLVREPC